jgi:hypothetical protein
MGGGVPIPTRGQTLWYSRMSLDTEYMYFVCVHPTQLIVSVQLGGVCRECIPFIRFKAFSQAKTRRFFFIWLPDFVCLF